MSSISISMKKWALQACGLALLLAGIFLCSHGDIATCWNDWFVRKACLSVPERIDLGEQERFRVATGKTTLKNEGNAPLLIHKVVSSCGCVGLEREIDGSYYQLQQTEILPGEQLEVSARLPVRGHVGESEGFVFDLYSNDPIHPIQRIAFVVNRITGGLEIIPSAVHLGDMQLGKTAQHTIELFDSAQQKRTLQKVVCTSPDATTVQWHAAPSQQTHPLTPQGSRWLGSINLRHLAQKPGPFKHEIIVTYYDEFKSQTFTESIPVRGAVLPVAEVIPSSLILPRRTGQGWLREVRCKLRFSLDGPTQLSIVAVPEALAVDYHQPEPNQAAYLNVRLKSDALKGLSGKDNDLIVKLKAQNGPWSSELDLQVHVQAQETGHEK